MNSTKLYIRCDGGPAIGMGHVYRCVALAQMLEDQFDIVFLLRTETTVQDVITHAGFAYNVIPTADSIQEANYLRNMLPKHASLLLDGYAFDHAYQEIMLHHVAALIYIDDLHQGPYIADVVINHAPCIDDSLYQPAPHTHLHLGLNYAILRRAFLTSNPAHQNLNEKHILLSLGASDHGNANQTVLQKIHSAFSDTKITILTSTANPNTEALLSAQHTLLHVVVNADAARVAELLSNATLLICTASTISIEACALGVPMIVGYTAENQQGIYQGLLQLDACLGIGSFLDLDEEALLSSTRILLNSDETRNRMVENQRVALDKQSKHRIAEAIHRVHQQSEALWWREVRQQDMMLLFEWANDPDVRSNSFNSEPICIDTHERWLKGILQHEHAAFFLFFHGRAPIGQLRLEQREGVCILSYSVAKAARGHGYGKELLKYSLSLAKQYWPNALEVAGYVKPSNQVSQRAFHALGFSIKESTPSQVVFSHPL